MTDITLPYNFKPRNYQLPVLKALDSGFKRVVLVWNRRSGKDITIFNWCIKALMEKTCTCYYVMPTYSQAKKVIWDAVNNDGQRILDYIPKEIVAQLNQQEMKIRFINGSLFQLIGSDSIDALMGTNPKIVVFSEYALQSSDAWDFIRPIIKVNGGTAIFISTPRGRNSFYDLFEMAKTQPDWWVQKLTYKDTGVLTEEDIKKEIAEGMSEELALQEYECSFERGVDGSYYARQIQKMRNQDRITDILYDPYKLVHTAWDLGWDDSTAIIFFQIDGDRIKIIDYEEHSNKTLTWFKTLLNDKRYTYGTHLFPHDVEHVDGLSTGLTRKEVLNDLQIPVTTVPRGYIVDGIEAVKVLMESRLYISEKCLPLIKSLENYCKLWDEKKKVYHPKPHHNWASHGADAARYMAEGLKFIVSSTTQTMDAEAKALRSFWGG